ncbi:MAG: fused MFS/spermidine synthase, partial [Nitrospinota bacterium]|nr:fused MFS/spermidine synthase [Nitrospinota bacterium]
MNRSTPPIWPVLSIFFFSGAAGLAYEIVWARQLSLTLGVSVYAVSATLAAFMGGLGAGAELSGRMLDRGASPIRLYALCEALLGGYVLMFPLIWGVMDHAYLLLHGGAEGATIQVVMMRFLLAVAALAPPTLLMGATLPAIVRYAAVMGARGRRMAGTVYAINTAGAMVGTMAAGFALIEIFGLTNSLRIGAVVNLCCAAAAWLLAAEKGWHDGAKVDASGARKAEETPRDGLIVILYGVTGFCGLALELLWTRALILLLNNTTYAFSLVLSVFLFGTALGSALAARVKDRSQSRARLLFAIIMTSVGVMAMLSLVALSYSDQALAAISGLVGQGRLAAMIPGGGPMASALLFALVIIAPCTAMLGALFPLAAMALSPAGEKVGGDVGRLYAVNIVGCVAGSLAAGYYMIPWLGTQNSLMLLAMTAVAAGMALAFLRSGKEAPRLALVSAVVILPIAVFLANNRDIAFQLSAAKLDAGAKVEFYEEGPSATVLVSRNDSDLSEGRKPIRRLWINGDPIAGTFREALQLERLQAHIPLLMINAPRTALVICFGTGSTAAAALAHGLESVTAVDISREVFHAGPSFTD